MGSGIDDYNAPFSTTGKTRRAEFISLGFQRHLNNEML